MMMTRLLEESKVINYFINIHNHWNNASSFIYFFHHTIFFHEDTLSVGDIYNSSTFC